MKSFSNTSVLRCFVLCILWLLKLKSEGQTMHIRPQRKVTKVKSIGLWTTRSRSYAFRLAWVYIFHFSCKIYVAFSASSFCFSFGNLKIILKNPNPTSSLWLRCLLWLCLSTFSLSSFDFACLNFSYNHIEEENFSLAIYQVKRFRSTDCGVLRSELPLFPFTVHSENFVVNHK